MDWDRDFVPQMQRLRNQWERFYSDERTLVIWGWVKDLTPEWWKRQVTFQLGHHTDTWAGPLVELEQAAIHERDRVWRNEKARNHEEARDFFESTPMPENVREKLSKIGLLRKMPKPDGAA